MTSHVRCFALEEDLPADNPACHRSDWRADQETAHAGIIAIAPITFDVRAEKSACEEPAHAAEDGTRHDPCLRSGASSRSSDRGWWYRPVPPHRKPRRATRAFRRSQHERVQRDIEIHHAHRGTGCLRLRADSALGHLRMANRAINRDNGHKCERREQTDANSRPATRGCAASCVICVSRSRTERVHGNRRPFYGCT